MANSTVCQSKWKLIVEPRRAKPKTYRQVPTHWLKFYEEAVIESEARHQRERMTHLKYWHHNQNTTNRKRKGKFLPKICQTAIQNKNDTKTYMQRHTMAELVKLYYF